ncbi:MAG: DUF3750 domain-containing protein [Alphaproteobacteria bacterium]|nr:MAG: DUF3750 domain-containing protein [Alphaproteobacteria bacterium]
MRRLSKFMLIILIAVFIVPVVIRTVLWAAGNQPMHWRDADWSASGILPPAANERGASIRVLSARTGGYKGILSVHSWLVIRPAGAATFDRYDLVGWGRPLRKNAYPPDGRWYSNDPEIVFELTGKKAAKLIPKIEAAIAAYPWSAHGDYRIWPGPNSNTFVANILSKVPELGAVLPPTAIGRDFPVDGGILNRSSAGGWTISFGGFAGVTIGAIEGFQINLLGLVAGFEFARPALLLPGLGRISLTD